MAAEIPDGAVIVARAILNSSLWSMRPEDCKVAITCIALANHEPREWWNGIEMVLIEKGQFVRSWDTLSKACVLSVKVVRTCVQNLEKAGFLARHRARRYSVFTIPKYQHYQDLTKYYSTPPKKTGKTSGSERAASGQRAGSERATNKNYNNLKNVCKSAPRKKRTSSAPTAEPPTHTVLASPGDPGPASEGTGNGGPLTEQDVVRMYREYHPGVMRDEKALERVQAYRSRGMSLDQMAAALKVAPKKTLIWEIFNAIPKNGNGTHAEPAKPEKSAEQVREEEDRIELERKLLEDKRRRRDLAEAKLKELPEAELAVWRKEAEDEGRRLNMIGARLNLHVSGSLLVRVAVKFGIAASLSEF